MTVEEYEYVINHVQTSLRITDMKVRNSTAWSRSRVMRCYLTTSQQQCQMFVTSDQNHDGYFIDVVHNSMNFSDISIGLVGKSLENINEHTNGRRDTRLRIMFSKMMFIWMRWRSLVLILMEKSRSISPSQVYRNVLSSSAWITTKTKGCMVSQNFLQDKWELKVSFSREFTLI